MGQAIGRQNTWQREDTSLGPTPTDDHLFAGLNTAEVDIAAVIHNAGVLLFHVFHRCAEGGRTAIGQAQIGAAQANLVAGQSELARSRTELKRYEALAAQQLVALSDRDKLRTGAQSAQAAVLQSQAQIRIAEETLTSTQVARKSLEARVETAQAQLELTRIDLGNTVIRAPAAGKLGQIAVRVGQYVSPGTALVPAV